MAGRRDSGRYGVKPVAISYHVGFADDPPFTEQEIRKIEDDKRLQGRYNDHCHRLIDMFDDKIFLADSFGFVASLIAGGPLQSPCPRFRYEYESELNESLSLPERIKRINVRLHDASLTFRADITALHTLSGLLLSRGPDNLIPPELDTPEVLYRAFRKSSHGRYDKELGFRSSRQPFTTPSNYDGPLRESPLVTYDILKNHCEGSKPSDLIAMSDSPARILSFIKKTWKGDMEGDIIAVINVSKLLAMRVLFNRTTTLCDKLGIEAWSPVRQNGLSWVNRSYWVAYRWVPAECIEFYISIAALKKACNQQVIGK